MLEEGLKQIEILLETCAKVTVANQTENKRILDHLFGENQSN